MIEIGAFSNNASGSISLYRSHGPFSRMKETVNFTELPESVDWDIISKLDILFFSKPCNPNALRIAKTAATLDIPIWVDLDDDIFAIEPSNKGPYLLYSEPQTMEIVQDILTLAKVVTVSTEAIYERLKTLHNNVIVIPNATMHELVPEIKPKKMYRRNKFALWRGGESHSFSISANESLLSDVLSQNLGLTMLWMGNWPGKLLVDHKGRNLLEPGRTWFEFFKLIGERRPLFQLVLLNNCPFDHARSHNAWLESIMLAKCPVFAPAGFKEFENKPGVIHYTNENLSEKIAEFMKLTDFQIDEIVNEGRKFIEDNFSLSLMNGKRNSVLSILRA